MTTEKTFMAFYLRVLQEPALQAQLMPITDRERFVQEVVALGTAQGYDFDEESVFQAMQRQRQAWIERWIR